MKKITIKELSAIAKKGDILLTSRSSIISRLIRWIQELDGDKAIYTHAAIIPTSFAVTHYILESSSKSINYHYIEKYHNNLICLIRNNLMTDEKYYNGFVNLLDNIGQSYPFYRLFLHFIDKLGNAVLRMFHVKPYIQTSKLITKDHPVCSELIMQFLIGALDWKTDWKGIVPDDLHDLVLINDSKNWQIIFSGILINEKKAKKPH